MNLSLSEIIIDKQFQPRDALDGTHINNLREAWEEHSIIPAVTVWKYQEAIYLLDGFHRYRAAQLAGLREIPIQYFEGTWAEAKAYAFVANEKVKLPLTRQERCKYLKQLLDIEPYKSLSSRKAAEAIGDPGLYKFIQRLRKRDKEGQVSKTMPFHKDNDDFSSLRKEVARLTTLVEKLTTENERLKSQMSPIEAPEKDPPTQRPLLLDELTEGMSFKKKTAILKRLSSRKNCLCQEKFGKLYISPENIELANKIKKEINNE